ncbi:SirB2 family protein [Noviherbaspirillum massiliense]|uniref:SirB2 family protein n=1 Tax=Noviherbaspirillum massiliense TaxID=1465823 RepID=UPI0002D8D75A|nr:SirB2 family protein [Noviherbaspirillum massiliense]
MSYLAVKHIHVTFVALSGILFFIRGLWMMSDSAMLQQRWVKIVPHVVDTILLASALVMVVWSHQYPFVQNWLTAKLVLLVVYIGLGMLALKRSKSKSAKVAAFIAALAVFAYIIKIAITRQVF